MPTPALSGACSVRWTGRAVVVTDAVFSMDGDAAPVEELAQACADHDALLVLDEAHSVLAPHVGPLPCEVLRVGTLSKTLGSLGGFVAGARVMTEMLVNRGRPFIFTTALAPANAAAAQAALEVTALGRRGGPGPAAGRLRRPLQAARGRCARPSCPSWSARNGPPSKRRPPCWTRACSYRPYGLPPSPPVVPAYGSPCPPPTPMRRSELLAHALGRHGLWP